MTADEERLRPYRVLQIDPGACPEVIEAAFRVLREQACRDDSPAGGRRLIELNRAHREVTERARAEGGG
jgi:hypothetical protein